MEISITINISPKEGQVMRFYKQQHRYYCGIDLHARKMYICIINHNGKVKVHKNIETDPELFFELVFPFTEDVIIMEDASRNQRVACQDICFQDGR